jgi:signal transduction histidine kinase
LKTESAVNTKDIGESIAHTQRLVEKSVNTVRQFAYDLRPSLLDDLGLIAALHAFMKTFMKETGIRVHLTAFAGVDKLDSARRTVLYRVAQEALTNVARHAQASRVDVSIQISGNDILMQIKDNGRSFDVNRAVPSRKRRRLGLLGMRERVEMVGGKFSIESSPGQGTTIHAQVPFLTGVKKERVRS